MAIILIGRDLMINPLRNLAAKDGVAISAKWSGKIKTLLQIIAYIALLLKVDLIGNIVLWLALAVTLYSVYEYLVPNLSIVKRYGWVKYLALFLDKFLIYTALFILCPLHMVPMVVAFLIIAKDNILSGFRTMAVSYTHLVAKDDIRVVLKRGEENQIKKEIELLPDVQAPVEMGQKLGTLNVYIGDTLIGQSDAIAEAQVKRATLWEAVNTILRYWIMG